jgi:site-specific recombinase XerD
VTPTDLREYEGCRRTVERRQATTINRRFAALRAFFRWAKGMDLISELPTESVSEVPAAPRSPKALAKREVDRLIREAERHGNARNLAIVQLLRHTGLRVGERCTLRLGDLDIAERRGTALVRAGKGDKDRTLPFTNDVRRALERYLKTRPPVDDDHLFIGQRGEPLQPQGVQLIVAKYARRAGLSDVTPHILRHSFAKRIHDAGEDLATVQRLLGHERLEPMAIEGTHY